MLFWCYSSPLFLSPEFLLSLINIFTCNFQYTYFTCPKLFAVLSTSPPLLGGLNFPTPLTSSLAMWLACGEKKKNCSEKKKAKAILCFFSSTTRGHVSERDCSFSLGPKWRGQEAELQWTSCEQEENLCWNKLLGYGSYLLLQHYLTQVDWYMCL